MAPGGTDESGITLNLTPEERQVYGQLFRQADSDSAGIIIGEAAVKFFEKTRLDSRTLGEIWQIADKENRGFLTPVGFGVALRLIGHAQAGHEPQLNLALQPGPIPRFDGISIAASLAPTATGSGIGPLSSQGTGQGASPQLVPQGTGGGTRVPPLPIEKAAQYSRLFREQANGESILSGDKAKRVFEKSGLSIEILGRIWQLADTEQRGALVQTEFVIAMHLLTSTKLGTLRGLPAVLPAGLYEAATRGAAAAALGGAASPGSPVARQQSPLGSGGVASAFGSNAPPLPPPVGIQRQGTGGIRPLPPPNFASSIPPSRPAAALSPNSTGGASAGSDWAITAAEKERMNQVFANLDKGKRGFITGDEAVPFLMRSGLSEDALAQVWDLADVTSEGRLNSDTFAVALHLIQQQRQTPDIPLPTKLPANLVPPSLRSQLKPTSPAPAPQQRAAPPAPPPQPKSAMDDLFGLDAGPSSAPSMPALTATPTGGTIAPPPPLPSAAANDPFAGGAGPSPPTRSPTDTSFKPFVPSSSFGRSLTSQVTGDSNSSAPKVALAAPTPPRDVTGTPPVAASAAAQHDLLGGDNDEASRNLSSDSAELANLSNQVGSLSKHMQDVSTHRSSLQTELSQTSAQKRNFEQRLAQLRTLYEKEARDVRALEEQLNTSRTETKKLQTELAAINASYQQIQTQHQQVTAALQADQQENTSLKGRLQAVTSEVSQLKPLIEKLKSEARQQKGIVAINRKQLSLAESERDKLKTDSEDLARQNQDLARQMHNASVSSANSTSASPSVASASGKNPFFRRTGSADIMGVFASTPAQDKSTTPPSISQAPTSHSFDDVFGPGPTEVAAPAAAAATVTATGLAAAASVKPQTTGASSGSSSFSAVTAPTSEAATPSVSRQPTMVASPEPKAESPAGNPPTSTATPEPAPIVESTAEHGSPSALGASKAGSVEEPAAYSSVSLPATAAGAGTSAATAGVAAAVAADSNLAAPPADTENEKPAWSPGHEANDSLNDPFTVLDHKEDKAKQDFESAFASFKAARAVEPSSSESLDVGGTSSFPPVPFAPVTSMESTTAPEDKDKDVISPGPVKSLSVFNTEFPPISELNRDDESDSDSEGGGFDDDFAPVSPPKASQDHTTKETIPAALAPTQAAITAAAETTTSAAATTVPVADADLFSAPNAPPTNFDDIFSAPTPAAAPTIAPTPVVALTTPAPASSTAPAKPASDDATLDDLDDDFEGLEDAKEGSADDDFANISRSGLDDFQSGFDSSPSGKQEAQPSFGVDSSFDLSSLGASTATTVAGAGSTSAAATGLQTGGPGSKAADNTDWFSFAGDGPFKTTAVATETPEAAAAAAGPAAATKPEAEETANDDPILQKLTSMGYARSVALTALEKYDYNVDRAANYLANQS